MQEVYRFLFKFRSGMHGLNKEQGWHRRKVRQCSLCENECEYVSHVFWQCSALYIV